MDYIDDRDLELLTIDEAAARLRCGRTLAKRLMYAGEIDRVKIAGKSFISAISVRAYLARQINGGAA